MIKYFLGIRIDGENEKFEFSTKEERRNMIEVLKNRIEKKKNKKIVISEWEK